MPIERMKIPTSKWGRSQCCVYGVKDPTGAGRDMVCGVTTTKFWDSDAGCYAWRSFCPEHQIKADAQDAAELMEDEA
jgi:hypothetical protein